LFSVFQYLQQKHMQQDTLWQVSSGCKTV
jgi:hypothetical protein